MPLVSIISPLFNSERFIPDLVASVQAQSFSDWEMILVDDCSSDGSVAIAEAFVAVDARVKLIKLDVNSGAAVARNAGIKAAQGRYIAFLDSDDVWLPTKLEKQLEFMRRGDIAFSYCAYEKIDEEGEVFGRVGVPRKVSYRGLLKVCVIGCLTAMYDTEKVGKVYMPLIRKRQDLGLWLRILRKVPYAHGLPDVLARYRVRSDSISANKRVAARYTWQLYREHEQLSFLVSLYYFSFYAVNGILRTRFPRLARLLGVLD